jgi:Pyruvate/2-oxoacid:ferredoxin oxidoreductase delta subunit
LNIERDTLKSNLKDIAAYTPNPIFLDAFPDVSGNTVNGRGETEYRRASPFFWHPPGKQQFGRLQRAVTDFHQRSPEIREAFNPSADRGVEPIPQAQTCAEKSPQAWTAAVRKCSLANPEAGVEVGRQYNRAARACRALRNFILSQGYFAKAYQGPYASALNMMPAAIEAGFGELGKHGSLINRHYRSMFRLSAVTTDMPLVADVRDEFCADEFCTKCRVCTRACPPEAISDTKRWVRGVEKWSVDFDKCIPYFGETLGCGVCIARCPWSKPGTTPRFAEKLLRRRARRQ